MILMIHEIRNWMLKLDLSDFDIITFDDGLYSQFVFYEHFLQFNKPMIFFISSGIVCGENEIQSSSFPSCSDAHKKFFNNGDKTNYMKWTQIHLLKNHGCEIGGHGFNHLRLKNEKIVNIHKKLSEDIDLMIKSFNSNNIKPISFCFPYNKEYVLYKTLLKNKGFINFYGEERIAIESLK